jgi:DNA ligase-1
MATKKKTAKKSAKKVAKAPKKSAKKAAKTSKKAVKKAVKKTVKRAAPARGRDAHAERILARAKSQGRSLRQDEKAKVHGPKVLLAHAYEKHPIDPKGWWQSEKLDGVRAYWDGRRFVSRQGNVFPAPDFFKKGMPPHPMDGELWMARRKFQDTLSVVKTAGRPEQWKKLKYLAFDLPAMPAPFEERLVKLKKVVAQTKNPHIGVVEHTRSLGREHLKKSLTSMVKAGGEGLMLRKPNSRYEPRRSASLLKVKKFRDAEAKVIAHQAGEGKNRGVMGALVVKMPNGKTFKIGTGFSDAVRRRPPKIGSKVTYRYMEVTDGGIPKGASFVAVRDYE